MKHANLTDLQRAESGHQTQCLVKFRGSVPSFETFGQTRSPLAEVSKHFLVADHPSQQHASGEFDDEPSLVEAPRTVSDVFCCFRLCSGKIVFAAMPS